MQDSKHYTKQHQTPYLLVDLASVDAAYARFCHELPTVQIHYAMKCNPHPDILRRLHSRGCRFEIASYTELKALLAIGVDPSEVLFSNPVKSPGDIRQAFRAGVQRFAFDSLAEIDKLVAHATGSSVYVRVKTTPHHSLVPSEGKFGVDATHARSLLLAARDAGLVPYGIAFHVGSQMLDPEQWQTAIMQCAGLMRELQTVGITIQMLDIGGGFPAHHGDAAPGLGAYATIITKSLKSLPYKVAITAEPGRALVGDAGIMVSQVIGVAARGNTQWVHLDVGAFNGMMEALESQNKLLFPLQDSKNNPVKRPFAITGPSCDSQDTILYDAPLSANIAVGDIVYLHTAGAYTTSYASTFNGFRIPKTYCIN
ncbi:MAG TPA: type III PLP-dependent enzyme [Candidatus Saccharimonadales bacterium]|nr:type III PLP-dependent enzyme [Candidatus Saccharimonadales bacterium]